MMHSQTDLIKIINRLEIIKSLVLLEEEEEIELQISKLKILDIPIIVFEIIIDLKNKSYESAINKIEVFVNSNNEADCRLIPFRNLNKWGFCNASKEIYISCIYDYVYPFENKLAIIIKSGKYGVIDRKGSEVIPCDYDHLHIINDNLIAIMIEDNWGFIDSKNQKVIDIKYSNMCRISSTYIFVQQGDLWGIIDGADNIIVDFKYDRFNNVGDNMCAVKFNGKWGFVNTDGVHVIECKYDSVGTFSEGLCQVKLGQKWGFINKEDKLVINYDYRWGPSKFGEGIAKVWKDTEETNACIIIDKNGIEIDSYKKFDNDIDEFSEGLALVRNAQKMSGFINTVGELVIPCIYEENDIGKFTNGIAQVCHYYSHRDEWDTGDDYYYDIIGYIDRGGVEYWDDGHDPQYYLEKYTNKESKYVHNNYKIYLCNKAIKLDSNFAKAYFEKGCAIIDSCYGVDDIGLHYAALSNFEKAIEIEPKSSEYLYRLGNTKLGLLDYGGAIAAYDLAFDIDSTSVDILINRGKAKQKIGDVTCFSDWTEALKIGCTERQVNAIEKLKQNKLT